MKTAGRGCSSPLEPELKLEPALRLVPALKLEPALRLEPVLRLVLVPELELAGTGFENTGVAAVGRLNTLGGGGAFSDAGRSTKTSLRDNGLLSAGGAGVKTLGGSPSSEENGLKTPLLGVLGRDRTAFSLDRGGGRAFSLERDEEAGGGIGSFTLRTRRG